MNRISKLVTCGDGFEEAEQIAALDGRDNDPLLDQLHLIHGEPRFDIPAQLMQAPRARRPLPMRRRIAA
jgi:hypothetical protein